MNLQMMSRVSCQKKRLVGVLLPMAALFAAILMVPTASHGQTVIPLTVQPSDNWNLNVGTSTGGVCRPLNPMEFNFLDLPTSGGPGVWMASGSNSFECCSCIRRSREYPLGFALNTVTNDPRLQGFYFADRGISDTYSIASIRVELVSAGFVVGNQVYAPEIRPNNNCASGGPVNLLPVGNFDIPLSSFGAVDFDDIRIHLMGYACGPATNTIEIAGLTLFVP